MKKTTKSLTIFSLAMINLAAVLNLKNWSLTAQYGFSSVFFYLLAAIIFFIPVALVSAELATGWSKGGGIYTWVKEAFGHRTGFLAIWLLWAENLIWYPTALAFVASTIAYIFNPNYAENMPYIVVMSLIIFWAATFANMRGIRISSMISTIGVIFGMFIPAALILILGVLWLFSGNPIEISFTWNSFVPNMGNLSQIVLFSGVVLSLAGLEMSAIHAKDVKNPSRNYPAAILLSAIIILSLSILGVLSIAMVVPKEEVSLVAGALQAFAFLLEAYNLKMLIPVFATLITVGILGNLSTWTLGPTRGVLSAAQEGDLPPFCHKVNKHDMPINLLFIQAVIVSLLSLIYLLIPSINTAFWILVAMVAQLYVILYILMFSAALKLRYSQPNVERAYKIPFKNIGIWVVSLIGIATCIFCLIIGFVPPEEQEIANQTAYILSMIGGVALFCLAPSIILLFKKKSWNEIKTS